MDYHTSGSLNIIYFSQEKNLEAWKSKIRVPAWLGSGKTLFWVVDCPVCPPGVFL